MSNEIVERMYCIVKDNIQNKYYTFTLFTYINSLYSIFMYLYIYVSFLYYHTDTVFGCLSE